MSEPEVHDRVATFQDVLEQENRITDLEMALKDGRVIPWTDRETEAAAAPLLSDRVEQLERELAEMREWQAEVVTAMQAIAAAGGLFTPTSARRRVA